MPLFQESERRLLGKGRGVLSRVEVGSHRPTGISVSAVSEKGSAPLTSGGSAPFSDTFSDTVLPAHWLRCVSLSASIDRPSRGFYPAREATDAVNPRTGRPRG